MSGRALTEAEMRVLEMAHFAHGQKPVCDDDVPSRNGKDLWGNVIPGRRVWNVMMAEDLVYLPDEEPITLDNGEPFTFTAFYELSERGLVALRTGHIPPPDPEDRTEPGIRS